MKLSHGLLPVEIKAEDVVYCSRCVAFLRGPETLGIPGSYRVVLDGDNLVFEERHGDGRDVRGILLQEDAWLVAPQLQLLHGRGSLN